MKLTFDFAGGERLVADVLPDRVSQTAQCVAAAVPISATVYQARWSGREIFVPITLPKKPARENQTIRAGKGDVIYFCEWQENYDFTGFEAIGLFYGNEIVREWRGDCPVNVFARISRDQFSVLDSVGDRVWRKGGETIKIDVIK
jgi:Protein of unknown function (DUF3830)